MFDIKDIAGISEPFGKFIDAVKEGIGGLSKPLLLRMMHKAKIQNAKDTEAFLQSSSLFIDYKNGDFEISNYTKEKNNNSLLINEEVNINERTQLRENYQGIKKQNNIENIISHSFDEFINDENLANNTFESVDCDWLNNFFTYAENISNDDMQKLWGKILSDEIKKPNSYSLRTLDFLRKMTKNDAERFQKVAQSIMFYGDFAFIFSERHFLNELKLSFGDLLLLEDIGLMSTSGRSLTMSFDKNEKISIYFTKLNDILILENNERPSKIEIYMFNNVGMELAKLISNKLENNFIDKAALHFKNKYEIKRIIRAKVVEDYNSENKLKNEFFFKEVKTY